MCELYNLYLDPLAAFSMKAKWNADKVMIQPEWLQVHKTIDIELNCALQLLCPCEKLKH